MLSTKIIKNNTSVILEARNWSEYLYRIIVFLLTVILCIALALNLGNVISVNIFHDAQETLYIYNSLDAISTDYATNFLQSAKSPILYSLANKYAVWAGFNLVSFHKFMIVICYFILLAGALLTGYRIGGTIAALALSIIIFAHPIYSYQINSATPHSFAFPLLMLGFAFTLYGRTLSLALLTVLSSFLYNPVSVSLWLILAWHSLITQKNLNFKFLPNWKTLAMLVVTGLIALVLLLQQMAPIEGFGNLLNPFEKSDSFPENGPEGRVNLAQSQPFIYVLGLTASQINNEISGSWKIMLLLTYLILSLYGFGFLIAKRYLQTEILGFVLTSVSLLFLVYLYNPFISYRFFLYPLFTILPVLAVIGILYFVTNNFKSDSLQAGVICSAVIIFLCTFNNTDFNRNIFVQRLDEPANKLMVFVKQLPTDSVIAAWPLEKQTGLIPYITGRQLFINGRFHSIINYELPLLEMRRRMYLFLNSYLSIEEGPLRNLHCVWNVDYIIIDKTHFIKKGNFPKYFEPFQSVIDEKVKNIPLSEMILSSPPKNWIVFSAGNYLVIDLARISDAAMCSEH